ncbi:MAG TPA: hypothetical protein VNI55_00935 [Gaiellaceae bacterium]|nr:hypothetical protein [Gaiellaceae bacterium]
MAAGLAAGLVAALLVTLALPSTYRASGAVILVRQGQPPGGDPELAQAVVAARELLRSRAVADSAVANLKLGGSPEDLLDDVTVSAEPDTSLVRFSVDADDGEQARRIGQELAEVFTVLYNGRFGPGTTASIWEAPQAEEGKVSPRPGLNLALGGGLGLLTGAGLLVGRRRRRGEPASAAAPSTPVAAAPPVTPAPAPPPDPRVQERVAAVTARELALARRAAKLALRERELVAARPPLPEPELEQVVPEQEPVVSEPEPEPEPVVSEPEPAAPVPMAEPRLEPFVRPRLGEWTIGDVERLLAEQGNAFPEQTEELGFYLDSFRDVAGPDGSLPARVEIVIEDVFADLIDRARSAAS